MSYQGRVTHAGPWRPAGLLAWAWLAAAPAAAVAAPAHLRDQRACAAALEQAQEQERTGSLLEAKDLLLSCSRAPCVDFVRRQCASRHGKLEADTPTIVFMVTDASGAPRNDVQVRIDGTLLEGPMDGHPVEIDPGFHDFSFIANGHVFATQKIMIVQGQRNRFVSEVLAAAGEQRAPGDANPSLAEPPVPPVQSLRPPISTTPVRTARRPGANVAAPVGKRPAPATTTTARNDAAAPPIETEADTAKIGDDGGDAGGGDEHPPAAGPTGLYRVLPWALGGVALAGVGAGALLTTWGRRDNDQLAMCAPTCNSDTLRHIRRLYTGADVAFGVGIAALGAAYWVYALGHGAPGGTSSSGNAGETALRLDLAPTRSGGVASVSGRF